MFVLVAYDVADDARRNRVARLLGDYGERVNLSVFECAFKKPEALESLKKKVLGVIAPREDHIRYYTLCAECRAKTAVQGCGRVPDMEIVRFV